MRPEDKAKLIEMCRKELMAVKLGAKPDHSIDDKKFWETMRRYEKADYFATVTAVLREEINRLGLREWAKTHSGVRNIFEEARNYASNNPTQQDTTQGVEPREAAACAERAETN